MTPVLAPAGRVAGCRSEVSSAVQGLAGLQQHHDAVAVPARNAASAADSPGRQCAASALLSADNLAGVPVWLLPLLQATAWHAMSLARCDACTSVSHATSAPEGCQSVTQGRIRRLGGGGQLRD